MDQSWLTMVPSTLVFVGVLSFVQSDVSKTCENQEVIPNGSTYMLEFTSGNLGADIFSHQFSSSCKIFLTQRGLRLRASILYKPSEPGCDNGYLSIGNDKHHLDKNSLTAYQFCDHTEDEEIVSRSDILWIVIKRHFNHNVSGYIKIESKPTDCCIACYFFDRSKDGKRFELFSDPKKIGCIKAVVCNSTQFRCSPIQCVSAKSVCDDVRDCENGRDEYCGSSNSDARCFLCDDGSACISPKLSKYDYKWGKPLWYICDGFPHCSDSSDEQSDKCELPWRLEHDLISCSTQLGRKILTWKTDRCNELSCSNKTICLTEESDRNKFYNSSFIIPACALICVAAGALCVFVHIGKRKRRRKRKPEIITRTCQLYRDTHGNETVTRLRSHEDQLL